MVRGAHSGNGIKSHSNPLGNSTGMSPTGIKGSPTGINIFGIENGKIAEHRGNSDDPGMMMPLGAISMRQPRKFESYPAA